MNAKENSEYIEDAIMKLTSVKKEHEEVVPPAKIEGDFVQSAIYKLIGQDDTNEETKESPAAAETKKDEADTANERVDRFSREDLLDEIRLKNKFITAESIIRDRSISPERKPAHNGKRQPKGRNITPLSKSYSFMSKQDQKDLTTNPNKGYTLVQLYNNYTKTTTEFFDPSLQYGGESIVGKSADPRLRAKYVLSANTPEDIARKKKMARNYSFPMLVEKVPWRNVKEFFEIYDTPSNRTPSPSKVNMLIQTLSQYS
eukprot:TRINITY_DN3648_c0_g1_i18.p1 TRINITY_DN3648_c0_g1~~TRINITY_DN3648_c0_g1_i18.p1  ORF type:complete len:258 (+),score=76.89 TRINITY_DN3648_c0_g1_i18:539-1312(+)